MESTPGYGSCRPKPSLDSNVSLRYASLFQDAWMKAMNWYPCHQCGVHYLEGLLGYVIIPCSMLSPFLIGEDACTHHTSQPGRNPLRDELRYLIRYLYPMASALAKGRPAVACPIVPTLVSHSYASVLATTHTLKKSYSAIHTTHIIYCHPPAAMSDLIAYADALALAITRTGNATGSQHSGCVSSRCSHSYVY